MNIDIIRPRDLSAGDISQWTAFQKADPDLASPFLSPYWPRAVEEARPDADLRVAVMHQDGVVQGYFPARVKGSTAWPCGAPMCDYQAVIAAPGFTPDPRKLVAALGVDRYDFNAMLQSQTAFGPYVRGAEPSLIVRLPFGYEAYAEDKNQESGVLKDLEKRRRKAERELGPITFTAFSRSRSDFKQLIEWKRAQYIRTGQTDIFATGWTNRLLQKLFDSRDPEFGGGFFTLHIGDKLAAAHFHLCNLNTVHAWIIAHDEAFERVSPGLLLFQDIMRWMDDTPYSSLDFGPGVYRFKSQLSNAACMIGHGFAARPSAAGLVRSAAYGLRGVAERLPLGGVSELPGKAMRRLDLMRALR